jgi:hypothetical protein
VARAADSDVSLRRHGRPETREVARGRQVTTKLDTAKHDTAKLVTTKLVAARIGQLILYGDADPAAGAARRDVRDL